MNEVKKADLFLVDPANFSDQAHRVVTDALTTVGIGSEDHEWILKILVLPECLGQSSGDSLRTKDAESIFENKKFLDVIKSFSGRSAKLLVFASVLAGYGPVYVKAVATTTWLADFGRLGNLDAGEIEWDSITKLNLLGAFYGVFVPEVIQIDQNGTGCKEFDDKYFTFKDWLSENSARPDSQGILNAFETFLGVDAAQMILDCVLNARSGRLWSDSEVSQVVLDVSQRFLDNFRKSRLPREALGSLGDVWSNNCECFLMLYAVVDRRTPETSQNEQLVRAWWMANLLLHHRNFVAEFKPDSNLTKRLLTSAKLHIGKMRAELKKCPDNCDFEHYQWAVVVLRVFGSPWQAVNALLLVFAEMAKQSVSTDLRYWNETGKPSPPEPYVLIPRLIANCFYPRNLRAEIEKDPTLSSFRGEFSKFCLSRLRTRKNETKDASKESNLRDEDFVEPRPWWRLCYVKAIRELGVNPAGKAHKTLFWLSQNDPDADVKTAAKSAYNIIRHKDGKDAMSQPGVSPRRPLFAAFWWLRQAHLLNLGIQVDAIGADRTRDKEIRRTRES